MTKYEYINKLPKEYHRIFWDIMILAESNKGLDNIELNKQKSKLIMRFFIRLVEENERLKENNQEMQKEMCKCWEQIDKAVEYINQFDFDYLDETYNHSTREILEDLLIIFENKGE